MERLDPPVLAVLRLGLFELLYLGGAAPHAAVNESVELAKVRHHAAGPRQRGPAPRGARGARAPRRAGRPHPRAAAMLHSFPGGWPASGGMSSARSGRARCCATRNVAGRIGADGSTPCWPPASRWLRGSAVAGRLAPRLARGTRARRSVRRPGVRAVRTGVDPAPVARFDARVPRPRARPGERVLDLCAAPGGKTTHLAALMEDGGEVVAVERHPGRAAALERTWARMAARSVRVEVGDGAEPRIDGAFRPDPGRPAVQRARHAPVPARSALAGPSRVDRASWRRSRRGSWPPRRRLRARRGPRVLGVHDLRAGERAGDRALPARAPRVRRRRLQREYPEWPHPGVPRTFSCCPTATAPTGSSSRGSVGPVDRKRPARR